MGRKKRNRAHLVTCVFKPNTNSLYLSHVDDNSYILMFQLADEPYFSKRKLVFYLRDQEIISSLFFLFLDVSPKLYSLEGIFSS